MKNEDVKIGMKVVPHDKTATGWGNLSSSGHWKAAQEKGQPFLFVSSQCTNAFDKAPVWVLGKTQDIDGDLFNASDFEPYAVKPRRKELRAEIERLKRVVDLLKSENAALYRYRSDAFKELAAKDAEIAELKRHDGIRVTADGVIMESAPPAPKKQSASEKQELLPVGTKVMLDYDKDIYAATIIKVNKGDPEIPYFVRFGDGQERWVRRRRVTSIPADLLSVGTRVMLTGTITKVNDGDSEFFPYGVLIDDDVWGDTWGIKWHTKSAVKVIPLSTPQNAIRTQHA